MVKRRLSSICLCIQALPMIVANSFDVAQRASARGIPTLLVFKMIYDLIGHLESQEAGDSSARS